MTRGLWKKAKLTRLKGRVFWRCLETAFVETALESGPNFQAGGRYSAAREFSAVYLSENRRLARLEKTCGTDIFETLSDLSFRSVGDFEVPDLTDAELQERVQGELGVGAAELTSPGVMAYPRTQLVARSAFLAGLPGLLVPSCQPPIAGEAGWINLVMFPANVVLRFFERQE